EEEVAAPAPAPAADATAAPAPVTPEATAEAVKANEEEALEEVTPKTEPLSILTKDGAELHFDVELAVTPEMQAQGLMYRTAMDPDAGMLFVFNEEYPISFWMKNTLIPLDMLFLKSDGTIHHIHHNAKPQDTTSITALYPSKAVLELNGGTADTMGIKEGDQVLHYSFRNVDIQR
ncbi:MAG: DUF192 domain-containing protein, partial [Magnetococcus sp. WYHC-3]